MEQAHPGEGHGDAKLVTTLDNHLVPDRTAGFCDIIGAAGVGALNIIVEGEESVGAKRNAPDGEIFYAK